MFGLFRRAASVGRTARTDNAGGFVPRVESLEGRTVPANIPVAAGDVPGLIAAITEANGNGEADTIDIAGTFTLTDVYNDTVETNGANGLPVILADGGNGLTINGNGAIIERSAEELTPAFRILE